MNSLIDVDLKSYDYIATLRCMWSRFYAHYPAVVPNVRTSTLTSCLITLFKYVFEACVRACPSEIQVYPEV